MNWRNGGSAGRAVKARSLHGMSRAAAAGMALLAGVAAHAEGLDELSRMARAGAPELALRALDEQQPDPTGAPDEWMRWESERIAIYQREGNWQGITDRFTRLPPGLPEEFVRWMTTRAAEAWLEQGRGGKARQALARRIWAPTGHVDGEALANWRRLVIRGYVAEGRAEDARIAMLRYRQDYGDGGVPWLLLRARVLLLAGRPAEAVDLLGKETVPEAEALYWLAQLRSGGAVPAKIVHAGIRLAGKPGLSGALEHQLWAMVAEAAERARDADQRVIALERALALPSGAAQGGELVKTGPDMLWDAYLGSARALGNKAQLLIGSDAGWFEMAADLSQSYPARSRAIYALLALRTHTAQGRLAAHKELVRLLTAEKGGAEVVRQLYLESPRFAVLEEVPGFVRHVLAEQALAEADIELASRLMSGLDEVPAGTDAFEWHLRRARVHIMAGREEQGAAILGRLLETGGGLEEQQIDRFMQVVFDLQTIARHEEAYGLFEKLMERGADQKRQREILFWMADSRKALGDFQGAARLYLRSATWTDPNGSDPWGESARYQAAGALAKAGLVKDARTIYQRLLERAEDPGRRAVLSHDLQRLWLVKQDSVPSRKGRKGTPGKQVTVRERIGIDAGPDMPRSNP